MPPKRGEGVNREAPGPAQDTTIGFCPTCGVKLTVVETRTLNIGGYRTIWRRKRCHKHPGRYSTLEIPEHVGLEVLSDD